MKKRALSFILLLSLLLCACSGTKGPISTSPVDSPGATPTEPSSSHQNEPSEPSGTDNGNLEYEVDKLLSRLTLEEKIGQMFFITSRYNTDGKKQQAMDDALEDLLTTYKPGGFIFFEENLDNISQTVSFIEDIQKTAEIPMFIAIDEEGGIVSRLDDAKALHSTIMPEPYVIGITGNEKYAYEASKAIAEEVKSLGFNLNFAPVADVFSNPKNKVIGRRAYSNDPKVVSQMVAEAIKGTYDTGVIPCIKHFPGHGDTIQDSHTGIAVVENDIERLRQVEFLPFKAGINAGVDFIMTAHVLTPKITDDGLPATLSKTIITDILRNELGFDGIIITDGLEMNAISKVYPEEEAVVMAIEAGVDMLLLPVDFPKSFDAVLSAVKRGKITEERIDQSVRRILEVKMKHIIGKEPSNLNPDEVLGSSEHKELAKRIWDEAKK